MMTELVTFIVGAIVVAAVGIGGYLGGRDAAERKAAETIGNLRRRCAVVTSQRDRAVESNSRMARTLGLTTPKPPEVPEWMQ